MSLYFLSLKFLGTPPASLKALIIHIVNIAFGGYCPHLYVILGTCTAYIQFICFVFVFFCGLHRCETHIVRACWAEGSSHPRTPKIPLVTSVFCIFNVILILIFNVKIFKEECSLISSQARKQPNMCEHPRSRAVTDPTPCPSISPSVLYTCYQRRD